jgi:hypothetical protein
MLPEHYLQHHVVYCEIYLFSLSFVPTDSLSLQALCQIFVGRLALIGEPVFAPLALIFVLSLSL